MTSPSLTTPSARSRRIQQVREPWRSARLQLTVALCIGMAPVMAADNTSAAAAALKVLTAGVQPTMADESPTTDRTSPSQTPALRANAAHSITVQSGESIDAVLRRALPGLPLKEDFLRQALAQANPKIFPKGRTYPVRPGTVLAVPTHAQLRQMILLQSPAAAALFETPAATPAEAPKGPDKRHWVRFP